MPGASERAADLALAHRLADKAGRVAMSWLGGQLARTKADGSIVTAADEAVEDALRAVLADERPSDAVLGEERGPTGTGSRLWLIDGIDGTDSFAGGRPEWGCLIALQVGGETVLGIAEQPPRRRRYWAVRGQGARRMTAARHGGATLRVSSVTDLASARGFVPGLKWRRDSHAVRVGAALESWLTPATMEDHPALRVAWGGYEAAVLFECGPWDLAAPALILEEAGGRFSALDGTTSLTTGCGLFTNGLIHDALLKRLRESLAGTEWGGGGS